MISVVQEVVENRNVKDVILNRQKQDQDKVQKQTPSLTPDAHAQKQAVIQKQLIQRL